MSIKVAIYSQTGEKTGEMDLSSEVFGVEPKAELIQRSVVASQANIRQATAHTKHRGEVRGGGKKPWQQKGTGRARAGSSRSPLWRGGGVVFGPRNDKNYTQKINKKVQRQILLMTLSDKVKNDHLIIVDNLDFSNLKTKEFSQFIKKLPIKDKKCLFLYRSAEKNTHRIAKNIKNVLSTAVNNISFMNILNNNYLLASQEAIKEVEKNLKK
ncbi:MAG: 50S ribosomal protein L4 [Patescibacteria group bacterium]|nr:50S ribosomal protein L4 [Patescibacteria group bacterium]MDD5121054.1 50S ribosomal protein L4 [Patescibacteria group bacterium]MDD5221584.1 50S ribosomal protein L4 [Patescibacteria group bacterium]MDD5396027.1 50S ribosomal protein L4 [Patescibacteria group bacterium]